MNQTGFPGPLRGIRIVDLTRFPPGGYCTLLLADLGAEVLRIEPPPSRGARPSGTAQAWLHRGKHSVTLNLREPRAKALLLRLIERVDVLVENAKPGELEAKGYGYRQASEVNPDLIWCSISGFGQEGPYAHWPGHDLTYTAHSGLLAALQRDLPWNPSAMLSVPLGAMMAATGISAALRDRDQTGRGCQIDVSLADAATWLLSGDISQFGPSPGGIPATPGRRLYECLDGRFISVAAAEPRIWAALCEGVGAPDLVDEVNPGGDKGEPVTKRLAAIFATRSAADWVRDLGSIGAAVGLVNTGADLIRDPHAVARGTLIQVDGQWMPANPIRMSGPDGPRSGSSMSPPPRVGHDTEAVLVDIGLSAGEIKTLREDGVV